MNYHFYLARINVYIGMFFGNTWEEARDKMFAKHPEYTNRHFCSISESLK